MARLMIVFDPAEIMSLGAPDTMSALKRAGIREASLTVPDNLEGKDIYEIARKLGELLLEQIEG